MADSSICSVSAVRLKGRVGACSAGSFISQVSIKPARRMGCVASGRATSDRGAVSAPAVGMASVTESKRTVGGCETGPLWARGRLDESWAAAELTAALSTSCVSAGPVGRAPADESTSNDAVAGSRWGGSGRGRKIAPARGPGVMVSRAAPGAEAADWGPVTKLAPDRSGCVWPSASGDTVESRRVDWSAGGRDGCGLSRRTAEREPVTTWRHAPSTCAASVTAKSGRVLAESCGDGGVSASTASTRSAWAPRLRNV